MNKTLSAVASPLLRWYAEHKRDLPWRQDNDPYRVWVSEIMLQQTRIEAVRRYYARFMQALPDVRSLSEVSDDALLKLWEGLGYYSRARNLKKAAQVIVNDCGGSFPQSCDRLIQLPGIGAYTAGAIASICFNERVPAVDGNVLRIVARLTGSRDNVLLPETKRRTTAMLQESMPEQAGAFNEALMELGETVCLPKAPDCGSCPLQSHCAAFQNGLTAALPVRIRQTKRKQAELSVFVIVTPDCRLAIEKRSEPGLLSGMYQLPNASGYYSEEELFDLLRRWELAPTRITPLGDAKHVFTHIDWLMKGCLAEVQQSSQQFLWVSREELEAQFPLPTAFRKVLQLYKAKQVWDG